MILTVKHRGKVLEQVKFWQGRDALEIPDPAAVLVGANGSGKSATLKALAAGCGLFDGKSNRDNYDSNERVRELFGEIVTDTPFAHVLRYRGETAHGLPSAVYTDDDFFRISVYRKSHGEAGLFTLAEKIMRPFKDSTGPVLLLLDEIETGLSAEAQTLVARSIAARVATRAGSVALVATQSDRVRREFLPFGAEIDFGGWLRGNPWREEEKP